MPEIKTKYDKTRNIEKDFKGPEGETRTQQQFKESCDINVIVKRIEKGTVDVDTLTKSSQVYGDFTDVTDFETAKNKVLKAERAFLELDPELRSKFDNDPAKMVAFALDPKNKEEAEKLKIKEPEETVNKAETVVAPAVKGAPSAK